MTQINGICFPTQINEKGHLRLSRRALLPDEPSATGPSVDPQAVSDNPKELKPSGNDNPVKQGMEKPKNDVTVKTTVRKPSLTKEITSDQNRLAGKSVSPDKAVKKVAGSAKGTPYINKDRQKDDAKVAADPVAVDGASVVTKEAKTG